MFKFLRVFYTFIFRRKLIFIGFILLVVISQILYNITPYFYKLFVEEIPNFDYPRLRLILLYFLAVNISALALDIASFWIGDLILFESASRTRQEIFKHVQDLDFAFHSAKSTGSLISAFKRGDSAFFTLFHEIHHRILEIVISSFVMFYFFSRLDWRITLLALATAAAAIITAKFLISLNIKKRTIFNEEEDAVSGILTDNLINYETVKLFAKEAWEQHRLAKKFVTWRKALWGYGNSFRLIDISIGAIINLSLFLILLVSLSAAAKLKLSVADFVLITTFSVIFFGKLWNLVWSFRDIAKNYADIQRYFGLLDYQIQVKDPAKPTKLRNVKGEIEFKNVSFSYHGRSRNAVHNFSLKIRQGQSIALVGRSGSGKTTLIKLLMRFYDVEKGRITIDKTDIAKLPKSHLRSFIGIVPQEPILFNQTIAYNIGYGKTNATLGEIKAAAILANIDDFIESLPHKHQTRVGERGVKLSGGQKQRLAIARMILADPQVIIFDEATSQLDSESEKLIQEAFWKAAKNKTTIIIAHRLSTVMRTDKIVVLEAGKIKEIGSHRELLAKKGSLYSHFWKLQMKLD